MSPVVKGAKGVRRRGRPPKGAATPKLVVAAVEERRITGFLYDGKPRIVEPHLFGIKDGVEVLVAFQTAGESNPKRPLPGWRYFAIDRIREFVPTEATFRRPREDFRPDRAQLDKVVAKA